MHELFAQIYAAPDDLTLRWQLADQLLKRKDPRGELIKLQLARDAGENVTAREADLLEAHGRQWLGPLAPWVQQWELERGFPARVTLSRKAKQLTAHDAAGIAEWRTVWQVNVTELDDGELLASPAFASLREVVGAASWLTTMTPLPRLTKLGLDHGWRPRQVAALAKWPALRTVELSLLYKNPKLVLALGRLAQLDRIEVKGGWGQALQATLTRSRPGGAFDTLALKLGENDNHSALRALLNVIPPELPRRLSIAPSPHRLTADDRRELERIIASLPQLEHADVPGRETGPLRPRDVHVFIWSGASSLEPAALARLWSSVCGPPPHGLGQSYAWWANTDGNAQRPLGDDPLATATRLLSGERRVENLKLYDARGDLSLTLSAEEPAVPASNRLERSSSAARGRSGTCRCSRSRAGCRRWASAARSAGSRR